jgi:medium-chain acyl-[acyl-carrier-protein] hydrolase
MIEYRTNFCFSPDEFDATGHLIPSRLLHLFQDAAGAHSDMAGLGMDELMKQNLTWVVSRLRYKILEEVEPNQTYTILTYPKQKHGVTYQRECFVSSESGKNLIISSSLWCIVDLATRRIARTTLDYSGEFHTQNAFEDGFEHLRTINPIYCCDYVVTEPDIDANQHTNNCRYADITCQALSVSHIPQLSINFSKETRLGETIHLYKEQKDDAFIVTGKLDSGDVVFHAKAIL